MTLLNRISYRIKKYFKIIKVSEEKKKLVKYLPKNPIILEAGAHMGFDTIEFAKLWKEGRVLAFEPVPDLYKTLEKNTTGFKNISTFPFALGKENEKSRIYISSGASNASSSLLTPKEHRNTHPEIIFENSIEVEVVKLDDWVIKNNIERIDFMWLDMQGYELNMLRSATNILKTTLLIETEVNLIENYEGAPLYSELKTFLESQNFEVFEEKLFWKDSGNVLFKKRQ